MYNKHYSKTKKHGYQADDGFELMCSLEKADNYHGNKDLKKSCEALHNGKKKRFSNKHEFYQH